jgi:hypothetical protein
MHTSHLEAMEKRKISVSNKTPILWSLNQQSSGILSPEVKRLELEADYLPNLLCVIMR